MTRVAAATPIGQNIDAGLYQRALAMARKRLNVPDKWEAAPAPSATTVSANTGNGNLMKLVQSKHGQNIPAEVQQAVTDAEGGNPEALKALQGGGWLPNDGDGPDAEGAADDGDEEQKSLLELLGQPGQ